MATARMDGDGDILGMRRRPEPAQPTAPTAASASSGTAAPVGTTTAAAATAAGSAAGAAARLATSASPLKRQRSTGGASGRGEGEVRRTISS